MSKWTKFIAVLLTLAVVAVAVVAITFAADGEDNADESAGDEVVTEDVGSDDFSGSGMSIDSILQDPAYIDMDSYAYYIEHVKDDFRPTDVIKVTPSNLVTELSSGYTIVDGYNGYKGGQAVKTEESSSVTYSFNVPTSGLYQVFVEFCPTEGKGSDAERRFLINGELPFFDAGTALFVRTWQNKEVTSPNRNPDTGFAVDNRNNDIRPGLIEDPLWNGTYISDPNGYYVEPYSFYLEAGENTITLEATKEPLVIGVITVANKVAVQPYQDYLSKYANINVIDSYFKKYEAELTTHTSSTTLIAQNNRSSATVTPYSVKEIKYNTVGGETWNTSGQWIEYEIEVPADGMYCLTLKYRQNVARGIYSTRILKIDGEVPFAECENLHFPYENGWVNKTIGDGQGNPYYFYLTAGTHTIRLEASIGDMTDLITTADELVNLLNVCYRKILMITGTTPDTYADYQLDQRLPGVILIFENTANELDKMIEDLLALTGAKGDKVGTLETLSKQLRKLVAKPENIPKSLDQLKTNIGSLSTWMINMSATPLEMDCFYVTSQDQLTEIPRANDTIWQSIWHEFSSFLNSFFNDYSSIGNVYDEESGSSNITVWITTGRDQSNILKALIDDTFVPATEAAGEPIYVNLQLVTGGNLLPAVVAGIGPDVVVQVWCTEPVNYAIRSAAYDLTQFEDYDEIAKRFNASALEALKFEGANGAVGVYGLPETETFPMLFYRTDVMDELGLQVPETWDDVITILPDLAEHNMAFGLASMADVATTLSIYSMFLYQHGGQLYTDDGTATAMDRDEAIEAFELLCLFYTDYGCEVTYDFLNRFRIGEMPISISDYSLYNTLSVFAPEIRGKWSWALVPGTERVDASGNTYIDRSVAATGNACMMLSATEDPDASWEFMKWWTSAATQVSFGKNLESVMGSAARYATANQEAFEQISWTTKDHAMILEQWSWAKGIPQLPGSYFTSRHLSNAFRKCVYNKVDPRETLIEYLRTINDEITNKRQEFGLPTADDIAAGKVGN